MSFALKKQLKKELVGSGWAGRVDEAAIEVLAQLIQEQYGGQLDVLQDLMRACQSDVAGDGRITADAVQRAAAQAHGGQQQQIDVFEVIDAFEAPRLSFDPVQRKLQLDAKPRSLHATAEAKHRLYVERLHLIQQRLQRNKLFQQNDLILAASHSNHAAQLTDVQSLKGVFGVTRYVLGCISKGEDGRYALEDSSGAVPLDLTQAETAAGFYTENCIVIAEGSLGRDGIFHVRALGLPPTEPRTALPLAAQRLNLFGGAELSGEQLLALIGEEEERAAEDRVVVLADVWLDQPAVMESLDFVFKTFSSVVTVPSLFVLMGNFHSKASAGGAAGAGASGAGGAAAGRSASCSGDVDFATMRDLFGQLAELVDQYPRLKTASRFVFVPGPGDPGPSSALPQPPLPRSLTAELRRVLPSAVFATNPCRLRYCTQQVVLFRQDMLKRLRRRAILPLSGSDGSPSALWGHLALTLLQQSHLCPLPLLQQPIYWQHDGALGLYPLPHAVLLADCSAPQEEYSHDGCKVINPGSFPSGFFMAYLPCSQQVEMSELPRQGAGANGDSQQQDGAQDEEQEGAELPRAAPAPGPGPGPAVQRQLLQLARAGGRAKAADGEAARAKQPAAGPGPAPPAGQEDLDDDLDPDLEAIIAAHAARKAQTDVSAKPNSNGSHKEDQQQHTRHCHNDAGEDEDANMDDAEQERDGQEQGQVAGWQGPSSRRRVLDGGRKGFSPAAAAAGLERRLHPSAVNDAEEAAEGGCVDGADMDVSWMERNDELLE